MTVVLEIPMMLIGILKYAKQQFFYTNAPIAEFPWKDLGPEMVLGKQQIRPRRLMSRVPGRLVSQSRLRNCTETLNAD